MSAHCTERTQVELKDGNIADLFLIKEAEQQLDSIVIKRPQTMQFWLRKIKGWGMSFFKQESQMSEFWRLGGQLALLKTEGDIPQEKMRILWETLTFTYDYLGIYSHESRVFIISAGIKISQNFTQFEEYQAYKFGNFIPEEDIIEIS